MRRHGTLATAAPILATAVVLAVACESERRPEIRVAETRFDFGEVHEQGSYTHEFVVENAGNADLVIEKVRPGGGGFRPEFDRVIRPGEKGVIRIALPGEKVHGNFSKVAIVLSNDPIHSEVRLGLTGTKIPWVEIAPKDRVYLKTRVGESAEQRLTVRSNEEGLDFVVQGARSTIDSLITYDVMPGAVKGAYEVVVRKRPDPRARSDYGSLTLLTNSAKKPEVVVQVLVETIGPIDVQPSTVNYGAVEFADLYRSGTPVTRAVDLIAEDGRFEISEIAFSSDRYSSEVNEVVPGMHYEIEVTFHPPRTLTPRHREVGEMVVHTTHPAQPTVRAKLVARAR